MIAQKNARLQGKTKALEAMAKELVAESRDTDAIRKEVALLAKDLRKTVDEAISLNRATLEASMGDRWVPIKVFEGTWGSRPYLLRLFREHKVETCYFGGKLCVRPKDFFSVVDAEVTSEPLSSPTHKK